MKYNFADIRSALFLEKYQTLPNTRRLCSIVGMTNIVSCFNFYIWIIYGMSSASALKYSLIVLILIHLYLNMVLIRWTLPYDNAKWMKWVWASLICVSPIGIMLIYTGSNDGAWEESKKETKGKNTFFHSLTNSSVNLQDILHNAIDYLNTHHKEDFDHLLKVNNASTHDCEDWTDHAKCIVIALHEALKQSKKNKVGFKDVVFGAHWYDGRHFEFAIRDPKSLIVPNMRYKYSFGFVVLDEVNNYQKILDKKKEIKANMKFGPAKAVCIHWGKGFKIYINE